MKLSALPTLSVHQRHLLQALFDEGGLSTHLITQHVLPTLTTGRVYKLLCRLRELKLIQSQALESTISGEHCWWITYDGAYALEQVVIHHEPRYSVPSRDQMVNKAETLQLIQLLKQSGWQFIRPFIYNSIYPKPELTPQTKMLTLAITPHFEHYARTPTPTLHPSQVPKGLNDWVAWPQNQPTHPVVLIMHPLGGSFHFWRHTKQHPNLVKTTRSRSNLYKPLVQIIPVIGIFPSASMAETYKPLLVNSGIHASTLEILPRLLQRHHAPPTPTSDSLPKGPSTLVSR